MKINWALLGAICSFLAGAVGTTLVPVIGSKLSVDIKAILQTLSALLVLVSSAGAVSVAHAQARDKIKLAHEKALVLYTHQVATGKVSPAAVSGVPASVASGVPAPMPTTEATV